MQDQSLKLGLLVVLVVVAAVASDLVWAWGWFEMVGGLNAWMSKEPFQGIEWKGIPVNANL